MDKYQITTQRELRKAFWAMWPHLHKAHRPHKGRTQNDYPTDVRSAWCDFVEYSRQTGDISEALAQRATL